MTHVRPAAVAGMFYPDDPRELDTVVRQFLEDAAAPLTRTLPDDARSNAQPEPDVGRQDKPVPQGAIKAPKALIAPHAGYIYSGPVAASAYAQLKPIAQHIKRVVLLGPCHRVPLRGLAAPESDAFATPLGPVRIDRNAVDLVLDLPCVRVMDAGHADEHSLEVHLPFLQTLFSDFALVPLVVGEATAEEVADVLERLWGGPETIIVISSDLSHYLDYETACRVDADTCTAIERLDPAAIRFEQACGRVPVAGLLTVARRRGLEVATLDLRNSGDTAGDRRRVVGYGAWVFREGMDGASGAPSAVTI